MGKAHIKYRLKCTPMKVFPAVAATTSITAPVQSHSGIR